MSKFLKNFSQESSPARKRLSTIDYVTYDKMLTRKASEISAIRSPVLSKLSPDLRNKTERILGELRGFGKAIVAFSGGIDSTVVAHLARFALGEDAIAVTADSPSLPASELAGAKRLAKLIGIKHLIIRTEELEDPNYISNPTNRCYFCKKELSEKLRRLGSDLGVSVIVEGTNADDLKEHRPGVAALVERGVRRPLADVGMTKAEVRELAKLCGLPNFDKPSMPCLSSRVQYGQRITSERLARIERSENLIRSLTGVKELRVRDHGDLARIEVGKNERELFFDEELLDRIGNSLRQCGFIYVAFDLLGYRSGSMNELLISNTKSKQ